MSLSNAGSPAPRASASPEVHASCGHCLSERSILMCKLKPHEAVCMLKTLHTCCESASARLRLGCTLLNLARAPRLNRER